MFCPKCGKQMDYDASYCVECMSAMNMQQPQPTYQQPAYQQPTYQQPAQQYGSAMTGFGLALASTIVGFFAIILSFMSLLGAAFVFITLGMSIFALVGGISGIKTFCREKNLGNVKPIATLILGISGLVLAAIALFYDIIIISTLLIYI